MNVCVSICMENSVHAVIECVGMLFSPHALKSWRSIEKIQLKMMCASFNGNHCTTINSYYSSATASDEKDIIIFNNLSSFVRFIPKLNVLIIGDMNAQIGKDKNKEFYLHKSSKRNGEYLPDFSLENRLALLKINSKKREGKLWTLHLPK